MADIARQCAYEVFHRIVDNDLYANLALPKALNDWRLNKTDAAFTTELVYGTIRDCALYDRVIEQCANRPVGELDSDARDMLRLGIHQLLSMRVATHAAVNETVNLAKQYSHRGVAGFINAIMRKASRYDRDRWVEICLENVDDPDERLGIIYSHPTWIVRAYRESLSYYGLGDEVGDVLAINNDAPYVHLVIRPGLADWDEVADQVNYRLDADCAPTPLSPYGMIISGGDPGRLATVRDSRVAVEDQGSQLVARIFADDNTGPWLDMCAGPGGKTALAASIAPDVHIDAWELHQSRADLVTKSCQQLSNVSVVCCDSRQGEGTYRRILSDVPCSGLGALRRRPELRWRERYEDLPVMTQLQSELLNHACDLVDNGGTVIYSTCSPVISETVDVVNRVIDARSDMMIKDAKKIVAKLVGDDIIDTLGPATTPFVQLWPHRHDSDAMFVAVLDKKG